MSFGLISIRASGGPSDPWAALDGRLNAPAGSPQYPTLLNSYGGQNARVRGLIGGLQYQPQWKVAAVDYYVGIDRTLYPTDAALTDWQTWAAANGFSNVAGGGGFYTRKDGTSNLNVEGVDFSLHGGCSLYGLDCTNTIVRNCKFGGTPWGSACIDMVQASGRGLIVTQCEFDFGYGVGNGIGAIVWIRSGGPCSISYCRAANFPNQFVFYSAQGQNGSISIKYNLIENGGCFGGTGPSYSDNAHCNYLQFGGFDAGSTQVDVEFNTTRQTPQAGGPGEGFQIYSNSGGSAQTFVSPVVAYNVMIAATSPAQSNPIGNSTPNTSMSAILHGPYSSPYFSDVSGSPSIHDNYFDPTGTYGGAVCFYAGSFTTNHGAFGPPWGMSGNIDMTTGAVVVD